jgi:hypothetical protein
VTAIQGNATSVQDLLRRAGIRVPDGERPEAHAEVVRIARLLKRRGCRSVGLVPAGDDVGVPGIALQLGLAMAELTGSPSGAVDVRGTWTGPIQHAPRDTEPLGFATSWLTPALALLTPRAFGPGVMVRGLEALVREPTWSRGFLVADLTALDHTGEHLEAMALLDGVAIAARSGQTTFRQLERWMQDIPEDRNVGVLLVGI